MSDNDNEWQWVTMTMSDNDNDMIMTWQWITMTMSDNDNEWQWVTMTMSDNDNDMTMGNNEWQWQWHNNDNDITMSDNDMTMVNWHLHELCHGYSLLLIVTHCHSLSTVKFSDVPIIALKQASVEGRCLQNQTQEIQMNTIAMAIKTMPA